MKIRINLLIILILLFQSCSKDSNNYKESIKSWLNTNLNDPESYEPIDFEVLDSSYLKNVKLEFTNYSSTIQRRARLSKELEKLLEEKNIDLNLDQFFSLNDSIVIKANSFWNFREIKRINDNILKEFQNKSDTNYSFKENYLNIIAQIKGTNARIKFEEDKIEKFLKDMCLYGNYTQKIRDDLLIKHKFRAKNDFGAKIINQRIFELNQDKSRVRRSCEIK